MAQTLLQTLAGLIAVITVFLAMAWLMRRFTHGAGMGGNHIKLLAGQSLGTKEKLVIVDAGGQQLLLGVTAHSINTLHQFDDPIISSDSNKKISDFSHTLQALLKRPIETTQQAFPANSVDKKDSNSEKID